MRSSLNRLSGAAAFTAAVTLSGCHVLFPPAAPPPAPVVAKADLLDTAWYATEILGRPVAVVPGVRSPHLVLSRDRDRVQGYTGCNSMAGGFSLDGNALRFGNIAVTRRACAEPDANALESGFAEALERARGYRLVLDVLELHDEAGTMLMRMHARGRPLP